VAWKKGDTERCVFDAGRVGLKRLDAQSAATESVCTPTFYMEWLVGGARSKFDEGKILTQAVKKRANKKTALSLSRLNELDPADDVRST